MINLKVAKFSYIGMLIISLLVIIFTGELNVFVAAGLFIALNGFLTLSLKHTPTIDSGV